MPTNSFISLNKVSFTFLQKISNHPTRLVQQLLFKLLYDGQEY